MKVLFDHSSPFLLAHGGFQIQIEQTRAALQANGVTVEELRWWDQNQRGDLIHFFGRPPLWYIQFAQRKGMKVILAQLLTGAGSRSPAKLRLEKLIIALAKRYFPSTFISQYAWESFLEADACVALTRWEAHLMSHLFGAPPQKVHVVPNGVEKEFLESTPRTRGQWLVCTATITERKRVLELAEAAVVAGTPVWILGKPYSDNEPYAQRFIELARQHSKMIRYEGAINERARLAQIYREARGFVLLSTMESLSLSALEAAACECPLLLSDLPWAKTTFDQHASYCPITSASGTAPVLRKFYDAAPGLKPPPRPQPWVEIGKQLKSLYESLLSTPR